MPPKAKKEVAAQEPLKKGEAVVWKTKDQAVHTGKCLSDEEEGKVQVALQTSRGRPAAWPYVLLLDAEGLERA